MNRRLSILLRFLFLSIVVFCFFNGRPPATAQTRTLRDAVQDEQIGQVENKIKQHELIDDARVLQLSRDLQIVSNNVSEMRGEERGIFAALAVLQILAMFFQFRKERAK